MDNQMLEYQQKLKNNINTLLENGKIEAAKELLDQYDKIVKDDIDVYSIKGVIAMMEGDLDEAEEILKKGLNLDFSNIDILYNLAYLCENQHRYLESYQYFTSILKYGNLEIRNEILHKVENSEKYYKIHKQAEFQTQNIPSISIITFVYNSKEYIDDCVKSVLNQSFTNFEWVILDNGCIDGTSEILEEYAKKDNRIKLFKNEVNVYNNQDSKDKNLDGYNDFTDYRKNLKSEYVALLDSDDFLDKDFCKDLYIAAKNYNSDIAVAGTEMFNDKNPNLRNRRCPPMLYIDNIIKAGDCFSDIYGSFRPLWGKLIRTSIYIKTLFIESKKNLLNGGDTYLSLGFLKNAKSLVSLNKKLHYYRIRNSSHYHSQVNKDRYLDYLIIYEESKKLLESWNKFNFDNKQFITEVLYYSLKDCIEIASYTIKAPLKDRVQVITSILSDTQLRIILNSKGMYINLINDAVKALDVIANENVNNKTV